MNVNETDDGSENSVSEDQPEVDTTTALKAEIESLKNSTGEMLRALQEMKAQQSYVPPIQEKPMAKEEFSELLAKDPQAAIQLALSSNVRAQTQEIESRLTNHQQQVFFDQKANQDFPLLTSDPQFQALVKRHTAELMETGVPKNSPKLVYTAAKNASLEYANQGKAKQGSGGMTSEAPSNVTKKPDIKGLPKNFDKMSQVFGLSEKAKQIFKDNLAIKAKEEEHRKSRG